MVTLTLRVMSRPDVRFLSRIYQSLGLDYDERVLPSIGNEVLKSIVAQFDAAELITQREVVSSRIREDLLKRAKEFNIVLEDVSIVSCCFASLYLRVGTDCSIICRRISSSDRNSQRPSSRSKLRSKMQRGKSSSSSRPSRRGKPPSFAQRARQRRLRRSRGRLRSRVTDCSRSEESKRAGRLQRHWPRQETSPTFLRATGTCCESDLFGLLQVQSANEPS